MLQKLVKSSGNRVSKKVPQSLKESLKFIKVFQKGTTAINLTVKLSKNNQKGLTNPPQPATLSLQSYGIHLIKFSFTF